MLETSFRSAVLFSALAAQVFHRFAIDPFLSPAGQPLAPAKAMKRIKPERVGRWEIHRP